MTRPLVIALVLAQGLDLLTYLQAPHLEAGIPAGWPVPVTVVVKIAAVVLIVAIASRLTPWLAATGLLIAIMAGAFGAGTAVGVLSSTPQPAAQIIPPAGWGFDEADPGRQTAVPSAATAEPPRAAPTAGTAPSPTIGTRAASTEAPRAAKPLSGYATWYAAPSGTAAAGPAVRRSLDGWRGRSVTVCGTRCVRVELADWCACGKRHGEPTLLDLAPDAFRAVCGTLSMGVCRVTVH